MTVAVVTGGSRGIGLAVAEALAKRGLRVAVLSRDGDAATHAAAGISGALGVRCDVGSPDDVARARDHVLEALGTPTVVVPNAGVLHRGRVHELSLADWDETLRVNLTGAFLTARAFLPSMLAAKRGRIVAVASISATLGTADASAYNASKWGLVGFVKSLAEELRGTGVQAMCVNPGAVDTEMLKQTPFPPAMVPRDVAGLVAWLALDAPEAMNGSAVDCFG